MHGAAPNITVEDGRETERKTLVASILDFIKSPKGIQGLVVLTDILALFVSGILFYLIRIHSGLFADIEGYPPAVALTTAAFAVLCWMFLFWFAGVYVNVHNRALFDEYYSVLKVILFGFVFLVAAVYFGTESIPSGQRSYRFIALLLYFVFVAGSVGLGRVVVRGLVKKLRRMGIGLRKTIIIGDSQRSRHLLNLFRTMPELGYDVVGTVTTGEGGTQELRSQAIGGLDDLIDIIRKIIAEKCPSPIVYRLKQRY